MKELIFILFILVFLVFETKSQTDSILILNEVEIIQYNPYDLANPDFLFTHLTKTAAGVTQQVGLYLNNFTNANIKSYGPNGLATISLDGLHPQHTQVFWNGIPVNTSTIGITDIAQYPFTSDLVVDIVKSTESFKYTGSQIGGAVVMENQMRKFSGISALLQNGSFGLWSADVGGFKYWDKKTKIGLSVNLGYQTARNDYSYQDYTSNPIVNRTLKNANFQKYYVQPSLNVQINEHHSFSLNTLYHSSDRDLTATVVSPNNKANQSDKIARVAAAYKFRKGLWFNNFSVGYAFDNLDYKEQSGEIINVESNYKVHKLAFNESLNYKIKSHDIKVGGNLWLDLAEGTDLATTHLYQTGLFAIYNYQIKPNYWYLSSSVRGDFHSEEKGGVSGNIALQGQPIKSLPIKTKVSVLRNVKFPTINDLYFKPSGNKDLGKETSWQINAEIYTEKRFELKGASQIKLQSDLEAYSIWLNDMIVWVPTNKIYWQPINLTKVHAKGLKSKNAMYYTNDARSVELFFSQLYHFAVSTNQSNIVDDSPLFPNDLTIGKQLPYIPKHQLKLNLFTSYKGAFVNLHSQYTSKRFITGSNSYYLQQYWLLDAGIGYVYKSENQSQQIRFEFTLKNALNNNYYQEVAHLPMPGRHYQISIKYDFQK